MSGGTAGGWDAWPAPEAAAVRALERAADAAAAALRHLHLAADVEWEGSAATGYRDALDDVVDGVRRTHELVGRAVTAAAHHAATSDRPTLDLDLGPGRLLGAVVPTLVPGPSTWSGGP